jgi:hypothetical protein
LEYITVAIFWLNKFEEWHILIYKPLIHTTMATSHWTAPWSRPKPLFPLWGLYIRSHPLSTSFTLYARALEQLQHLMQLNHEGQNEPCTPR